jgi:hypothetical protein
MHEAASGLSGLIFCLPTDYTNCMALSAQQKARYWQALYGNAQKYVGSAGLGNKEYQHLGIVIGPKASPSAQEALMTYARTDGVSDKPEDLFDAVINTHCLRAAWKTKTGYYYELWSAHTVTRESSDPSRAELLKHLDQLMAPQSPSLD